ncbi:conjugative transfer region protein TrbK [Aquamicrobium lusatiense]|uniref:Conjugative transfer region protein TrbK n=1 Tax=Aquamicrobium lusatiense TaxID=89772 RepID=A0A7W9S0S8_9HYPH|nr:conjugative transfer region protein TrbK [Aquamicrobium lusatiense]
MDGKVLARLGAVIFVAVAITATIIELTRKDEPPLHRGVTAATETGVDAIKIELRRCQQLGEAGTRDSACLRTWAENRERFLKPSQALQSQPAPQSPGPHGQPQNPPVPNDPVVIDTAPETDSQTNEAR